MNGESCIPIEELPPAKQQICCSRPFGERITSKVAMQQALCQYATRAAEKFRGNDSSAGASAYLYGLHPTRSTRCFTATLPVKSCSCPRRTRATSLTLPSGGLDTIWRHVYRYAKAGVMLGDFYQSGVSQFDMFSEQLPRPNADALMAALDSINRSGRGKVWFAGQGDQDSSWQMKREMLSPRYTTKLRDIPEVRG